MSEVSYQYNVLSRWTAERNGTVEAQGAMEAILFSAQPEFKGEPGFWTPEHFLLAGVASCFTTTLRALSELSKYEYLGLEVGVTGTLAKGENGYRFTDVVIRPSLIVAAERDVDRGLRLLEKAEKACFVTRSLNAKVVLVPRVSVRELSVAI